MAFNDADARLALSVRVGVQKDPAKARRILEAQARTGLPTSIIERNLERVEEEIRARDALTFFSRR